MTHIDNHSEEELTSQVSFQELLTERLREAVRAALITVLEEEVTAAIGAKLYERTQGRRDYRNGSYSRDLETTVGLIQDVPIPRTRQGHQTQVFERYHRRRDDLDAAIGEMFVKGVSTSKVGEVIETLTGSHPSASTVSRVFHTLKAEYEQWKHPHLAEHYAYAFADGTYFSVIYNGQGCKMPILAVVGITTEGVREVLGFRVGDRVHQSLVKATNTLSLRHYIIIADQIDRQILLTACKQEAYGYLLEDTRQDLLLLTLQLVQQERKKVFMLDPTLMPLVLDAINEEAFLAENTNTLTPREQEIFMLLHDDLKDKEIAEKLYISPITVRTHIASIAHKLNAKRRQLKLFPLPKSNNSKKH
jgi:DNA-binding NarL/FixJ family response regulator